MPLITLRPIIQMLFAEYKKSLDFRKHKSVVKMVAMQFVIRFKNVMKKYG